MTHQAVGGKELTRSDVRAKIAARLAGTLSAAALASWAFNRFYAIELGSENYESNAEEAISAALDALMFSDDPGFGLEPPALHDLIEQLA